MPDREMARLYTESAAPPELRLANFTDFVRARYLARFLGLYELFRKIVQVKGSIVDCGVYQGASLMAWAKLSRILDPGNARRHIFGFDTFTGFPPDDAEQPGRVGEFATPGGLTEIQRLVDAFNRTDVPGVERGMITLVAGDATSTIPQFIEDNPQLVVALLFLDFDLYKPTKVALQHFLPRMPKGAIVAFDELDDPRWPGETMAVMEEMGIRDLELRRLPFDATVCYAHLK